MAFAFLFSVHCCLPERPAPRCGRCPDSVAPMVPMRARSLESAGDHVLDKIPIRERLRRENCRAVNIERNKATQLDQYLTQTEAELEKMTAERNEALESLEDAMEGVKLARNKAADLDKYLTQAEAELDKMTRERNEALESLDAARLLWGKALEEKDAALKEIHSLRTEMKLAEQERAQRKEERKQKKEEQNMKNEQKKLNKMMATIANKMKRSAAEMETQARPKQGPTKTTQGGKGTKRAT